MRLSALLLTTMLVSACTAMVLGGGSTGASSGSAQSASDVEIAAQIRGHFAADSTVAAYNIGVRSIAGNVTLNGKVDNYMAREQAGRLAKATNGVRSVSNQIVVEN